MRITMTNIVKGFIIANPALADSDVDLIWNIWAMQLKQNKPAKSIEKLSARQLMSQWKDGKISDPKNISRSRRKCQELYPETRGRAYAKRHKLQERVIEDVKKAANLSD